MMRNRSALFGPLAPVLVYEDVGKAIDWLCRTFGFAERLRYGPRSNPSGAQLAIGEGAVFLTASRVGQSANWPDRAALRPPQSNEVTHLICVHVEDVDALYERMKRSGARIFSPPETHPFGERQFTVEDPSGHRWTFSQSVADVAPEDWGGHSAAKG